MFKYINSLMVFWIWSCSLKLFSIKTYIIICHSSQLTDIYMHAYSYKPLCIHKTSCMNVHMYTCIHTHHVHMYTHSELIVPAVLLVEESRVEDEENIQLVGSTVKLACHVVDILTSQQHWMCVIKYQMLCTSIIVT